MVKITDPDSLVVGTEITFNLPAKTFTLVQAGNLVAKDGVTGNALWAKFVDLWTDPTYQPYPFPMNVLDARSGQYVFGQDPGGVFNGWKPADDVTRQMIRDAGWREYDNAGTLLREYAGIVALASGFPAGAQFFFQRASGGTAINFTFTDAPNEAIQVFGNAANGNFDQRTYFRIMCREPSYTYDDAILSDVGETATGPYKISLPVSVGADLNITANDATVAANTPYTLIDVEYFGTNQNKTIGGGSYPFRRVIDGANATLQQIYTKMQYLLRQTGDIDSGAGTVTGKTADQLCYFVGSTLYTTLGVFIENLRPQDINDVVFLDQNGVQRTYPYASAGTLNFNPALIGGYFKMYFKTLPGASNDYGEGGAVVVDDAAAADISGVISGASLSFTFDYDGNVQGGRTAGTDAIVVVVAGNPGTAKPVVAEGTINRSKAVSITLTAETDRAYIV